MEDVSLPIPVDTVWEVVDRELVDFSKPFHIIRDLKENTLRGIKGIIFSDPKAAALEELSQRTPILDRIKVGVSTYYLGGKGVKTVLPMPANGYLFNVGVINKYIKEGKVEEVGKKLREVLETVGVNKLHAPQLYSWSDELDEVGIFYNKHDATIEYSPKKCKARKSRNKRKAKKEKQQRENNRKSASKFFRKVYLTLSAPMEIKPSIMHIVLGIAQYYEREYYSGSQYYISGELLALMDAYNTVFQLNAYRLIPEFRGHIREWHKVRPMKGLENESNKIVEALDREVRALKRSKLFNDEETRIRPKVKQGGIRLWATN